MTESVKLPDPVHKRAKQEANRRDISIGAVIENWMHDANTLPKGLEHRRQGEAEPFRVLCPDCKTIRDVDEYPSVIECETCELKYRIGSPNEPDHRLLNAEPEGVPKDAPRDESGDPILQDNE